MYDGALATELSVDRLIAELPFLLLVLAMFWSGASRIRAATWVSVGLMDETCPPSTVFAAYNAVAAPKEIAVNPFGVHRVTRQFDEVRLRFLRQQLLGESPKREGDELHTQR